MTVMSFRGKDAALLMPALREVEVKRMKGSNKYGAKKTMYRKVRYHSKKEAEYAMELDSELVKGKIAGWEGQETLDIVVNGVHICNAIVDFIVFHLDGSEEYVEVKGFPTDVWKLKRKLIAAVHPDIRYTVK